MHRHVIRLLTALSLLLCVAAEAVWVRSYRGASVADDHVSAYLASRGGRYTLRALRGRLTLFAPPPPPTFPVRGRPKRRDGATAEGLVPKLRNDQVEWEAMVWTGAPRLWPPREPDRQTIALPRGHAEPFLSPRLVGEPAGTLLSGHDGQSWRHVLVPWFPRAEITPPLLRALEHPDQYLAAHAALLRVYPDQSRRALEGRADGTYLDDVAGLRAVLTPRGGPKPLRSMSDDPADLFLWPVDVRQSDEVVLYSCSARAEPGALRAVRDGWHRLLDVEVRSAPIWPIPVAAAALPLARWGFFPIRRRVLTRSRRRRGRCRECGYDLTGNASGICPECGTPNG